MRLILGSQGLDGEVRGCLLTVGNFDGLHLGHQALIRAVVERGRELGRPTALYTFEPHPRRVLYPERAQPRLMTWEQLERGVDAAGLDFLIQEPFTLEFAKRSAESFLRDIIAERIEPHEIFVGRDFHFGRGRSGSGETLKGAAPKLGIGVEIISQVRFEDRDVSSSRIRELLGEGHVEEAAQCFGRPYSIWGSVIHGEHRGRTLGFPTANLAVENDLIPRRGVYATTVRLFLGDTLSQEVRPAVTNVGTRPTFELGKILTEAHLIDFEGDLYGRRLELSLRSRLRDERRFSGPDELTQQIAADVEKTRDLLSLSQ